MPDSSDALRVELFMFLTRALKRVLLQNGVYHKRDLRMAA